MPIAEQEALRLLADETRPLGYDDLDEVFTAFGFASVFVVPDVTWYHHATYPSCGDFRAQPRYDSSCLSQGQRMIVRRMIACVQARRHLEEL